MGAIDLVVLVGFGARESGVWNLKGEMCAIWDLGTESKGEREEILEGDMR